MKIKRYYDIAAIDIYYYILLSTHPHIIARYLYYQMVAIGHLPLCIAIKP